MNVSTPFVLARGCKSKIFKDKFSSVLDLSVKRMSTSLVHMHRHIWDLLSRLDLNQSSPSFRTSKCWIYNPVLRNPWIIELKKDASILNNWKASAAKNPSLRPWKVELFSPAVGGTVCMVDRSRKLVRALVPDCRAIMWCEKYAPVIS